MEEIVNKKSAIVKQYLVLMVGLIISSFGVALVTKANIGTSPISSIPYTLSIGLTPSIGMFTLIFSSILIAIQWLMLKGEFSKEYWLQIPVSLLFSVFIDLSMFLLNLLNVENYCFKLLILVLGCIVLAIGVVLEIIADVVMLPGESFIKVISNKYTYDFGKIKIVFDLSLTCIAVILSLGLNGEILGIGEGTLIAAVLVGYFVRIIKSRSRIVRETNNETC